MNELALKYGCNPNQKPSRIYMEDGSDLPVTVLNGKPGYINFLVIFPPENLPPYLHLRHCFEQSIFHLAVHVVSDSRYFLHPVSTLLS